MKRVLMIINYFYPDLASTGQLLTELCENLQDEFEIAVICTLPSFTGLEKIDDSARLINYDKYQNIKVIRIKTSKVNKTSKKSRIKYVSSYFFGAVFAALKEKRYDIVFTISQPPILGGMLGVLVKFLRRSKFVYCIEDFNPEQIEAVSYVKSKKLVECARALDNMSCKYADKVIVLGADMQETLLKRMKNFDINKSVIISNWVNEKELFPVKKDNQEVQAFLSDNNLTEKFIIMHSGNMGLYYDLDNLVKVFSEFQEYKHVLFVFVGEGSIKNNLVSYVKAHKITNICFIPYQPRERLIFSLNAADVHVVTNAKRIKGVSVPSKIYSIMAVGKPVLGILEQGSEVERLIKESGCGVVSEPQDYEALRKNIKDLLKNTNQFLERGILGRQYLEKNLTMKTSMDKYRGLLTALYD